MKRPLLSGIIALASACNVAETNQIAEPAQAQLGGTYSLAALDAQMAALAPDAMAKLMERHNPDENGLIGRNREWGGLYAARFQMGLGQALRYASALGQEEAKAKLQRALYKTLLSQRDGSLPQSVPELAMAEKIGPTDRASGTVFFMADACTALSQSVQADTGNAVSVILSELMESQSALLQAHYHAPNRLLFSAMAYHTCGQIAANPDAITASEAFVTRALELIDDNGAFIEGGGTDTSYHGVAMYLAVELLASGYSGDNRDELALKTAKALDWALSRTGKDGVIDSTGNARTCGGGETFIERKKGLDVPAFYRAILSAGVYFDNQKAIDASGRILEWIQKSSFPRDGCLP